MQERSTLFYFFDDLREALKKGEQFDDTPTNMAFEPSERSVTKILDFAQAYETLHTKSTGYLELNLN